MLTVVGSAPCPATCCSAGQLTSQLEDTRASLKRAERRATATADVRRRDSEAAAAAAAALSAHLEAAAAAAAASCVEGSGDGGDGGVSSGEAEKQEQQDSTATFVDLSGRWCGNEVRERTGGHCGAPLHSGLSAVCLGAFWVSFSLCLLHALWVARGRHGRGSIHARTFLKWRFFGVFGNECGTEVP